jgi:hypothetical protein
MKGLAKARNNERKGGGSVWEKWKGGKDWGRERGGRESWWSIVGFPLICGDPQFVLKAFNKLCDPSINCVTSQSIVWRHSVIISRTSVSYFEGVRDDFTLPEGFGGHCGAIWNSQMSRATRVPTPRKKNAFWGRPSNLRPEAKASSAGLPCPLEKRGDSIPSAIGPRIGPGKSKSWAFSQFLRHYFFTSVIK